MGDTGTWVAIGAAAVAIIGVFVYLLFMIFLPEWVGITGKVALDAEKSHKGGIAQESEFWTRMGQVPMKGEKPIMGLVPKSELEHAGEPVPDTSENPKKV